MNILKRLRAVYLPFFLAVFFLSFLPGTVSAVTTSGTLTDDETWSGDILITGDVTVPSGITLTVEPGTTVRAQALSDDQAGGVDAFRVELIIEGTLSAVGTDTAPIVFTSTSASPAKSDWYGIRVITATKDETFILGYCTVEYSSLGISIEVDTYGQSIEISNSTVQHTLGDGIAINSINGAKVTSNVQKSFITDNDGNGISGTADDSGTELSSVVSNCTVSNNNIFGIYIFTSNSATSTVTVSNNNITSNLNDGVYLGNYLTYLVESNYIVSGNEISNNSDGIEIYTDSSAVSINVTNNLVYQNKADGIYSDLSQSTSSYFVKIDIVNNDVNGNNFGTCISGNAYDLFNIRANKIYNNTTYGLFLYEGNRPIVILNSIYENGTWGAYCRKNYGLIFFYNDIKDNNGSGLGTSATGSVSINFNNLNGDLGDYELSNGNVSAINGRSNYWGIAVTQEMDSGGNPKNISKIDDKYDDIETGAVDYQGWLSAPVTLPAVPVSHITSPENSTTLSDSVIHVQGIAVSPNGISRVEISTDSGTTWQKATGAERWSYDWTVPGNGTYTLFTRAIDKVGNVEILGAGHAVTKTASNITTSGILMENETWSGEILLTGDVTVPSGITLTVEPGTTIRAQALSDDQAGGDEEFVVELIVKGTLSAVGTDTKPIVFTSSSTTPAKGDWYGIRVITDTKNESLTLVYCTIEYTYLAGIGVDVDNFGQTLNISHSTIQHNLGYGIRIYGWHADITINIHNNVISDNDGTAINVTITGSYSKLFGTISSCIISDNIYGDGIYINTTFSAESTVWIRNNRITDIDHRGIYCNNNKNYSVESSYVISGNDISYTGADATYGDRNGIELNAFSSTVIFDVTGNSSYHNRGYGIYAKTDSVSSSYWTDFIIANNNINNNSQSGIYIDAETYDKINIRANQIYSNNRDGLFISDGFSQNVTLNSIYGNGKWGAYFRNNYRFYFFYNDIRGNVVGGLYIETKKWGMGTVKFNNLNGNLGDYEIYNGNDSAIDARSNYWGTSVTLEMTSGGNPKNISKIYDKYDSGDRGEVDYQSWLSGQVTLPAAPLSHILFPESGTTLSGSIIFMDGVAVSPNGISRVEISTDGGATWLEATTDEEYWFYDLTVPGDGTYTLLSRAIDKAGNIEIPGSGVSVTIGTSPPPNVPTLNPVTTPTAVTPQQVSGSKDANSSVWLNNTLVVPADDNTVWSYDVVLVEGQNDFSLLAKNEAGESDEALFSIVLDRASPQLTATAPTDGVYLNAAPENISFTYTDATTEIDDTATTAEIVDSLSQPIAGAWSTSNNTVIFTPQSSLPDGTFTASVTVYDLAGNSTESNINFTVDTVAPPVPVLNPVTTPTRITTQQLSGTKEAGSSVWLNNTLAVPADESTTWGYSVTLPTEGNNDFAVLAEDKAGNRSEEVQFSIILDTLPPSVPTLEPVTTPTKVTPQQINGTKEAGSSVWLNNTLVVPADESTTWAYDVTLTVEGNNDLALLAEDKAGNRSTELLSAIVLDLTPPQLSATAPADGVYLNTAPENISFTYTDATTEVDDTATTATIVDSFSQPVAGTWSMADNTATFTPQLTLPDSTFTASVTVYDLAGNSTESSISFTIDTVAPSVPTLNPLTTPTRITPQQISGTKEAGCSVWLNNARIVLVDESNSWTYNIALPAEGANDFAILTEDRAGNRSEEVQFTIILDTVPPSVPTLNPVTTPTAVTPQQISGTKEAGSSVRLNNSVVVPADESTDWTYALSLTEGNNDFSLLAEDEAGNRSAEELFSIILDRAPPQLAATVPADGVYLNAAPENISFSYTDATTEIDDTATTATIVDSLSQPVSGTWSTSSNTVVFTPQSPFSDKTFNASVTVYDLAGNSTDNSISFTVDTAAPAAPTLDPVITPTTEATQQLTGTKEAGTSVRLNNADIIPLNDEITWTHTFTLVQGENTFTLSCRDQAGNTSETASASIILDTTAPVLSSTTPAHNSFTPIQPTTVEFLFIEEHTALNESATLSSVDIFNAQGTTVRGSWGVRDGERVVFTPELPFIEGQYSLHVTARDLVGNATEANLTFTYDGTPPNAPTVNPVQSPTSFIQQELSGTKDADASLRMNGTEILPTDSATTWSHTVTLEEGENTFTFDSLDRAGNTSPEVSVTIQYDETAPLPVSNLTVNGEGSGREALLDWTGYPEAMQADVASYRVYVRNSLLTQVGSLEPVAVLPAGTFTYRVSEGLEAGNTYFFAVVAVDNKDNSNDSVTPVSAKITDVVPPEPIRNLRVDNDQAALTFTWDHSLNTAGDLAAYVLTFNNEEPLILDPSTTSFNRTGLALASGYPFSIAAKDQSGNLSEVQEVTGVTVLPNPSNLVLTGHSGYVSLSWDPVQPGKWIRHYAVYVADQPFTSIESLTPTLISQGGTANVISLNNGTTYSFAVVTVNISGGSNQTVSSQEAAPSEDTEGPEITAVTAAGLPLSNGMTFTEAVEIAVTAMDSAAVSRVEFLVDGAQQGVDVQPNPAYTWIWDIRQQTDSEHTLTIQAFDSLGNMSEQSFQVTLQLALPEAPQLTSPASGLLTNESQLTIKGSAEADSTITVLNNGTVTVSNVIADHNGKFSADLELQEGENRLTANATNRTGQGTDSAEILVTLDTSLPAAPDNISIEARAGGQLKLDWRAPQGEQVGGYLIFRANTLFSQSAEAEQITQTPITATSYIDLTPSDDTWFYAVVTVDPAGNKGLLSEVVSVDSDRVGPRALSVSVTSATAPPETTRFAPGLLHIALVLSEPLSVTPFVSVVPEGGSPYALQMEKQDELNWTGSYTITENTPSGTAYILFSGRDQAGNRGTEIDGNQTLVIDTDGPEVTALRISPAAPIHYDTQPEITVQLGLSEAVKVETVPSLSYRLSGDNRELIPITGLSKISTQSGEAETWQAGFTLPTDAGLEAAETLRFFFETQDDLGNTSTSIRAENQFQVYQGELPPLAVPLGLTAQAEAGGKVALSWESVEGAIGYQLFRRHQDVTEFTELHRLENSSASLEYLDEPAEEATWFYTVASVRKVGEEESLSGMSDAVLIRTDKTLPEAPSDLTLELVPQGIRLQWQPPCRFGAGELCPVPFSGCRDHLG